MSSRLNSLGNDALFVNKVRPVLLDILCKGILETPGKKLALGALIAIAMIPATWPAAIFGRIVHLLIFGGLVAIFFEPLVAAGAVGFLIFIGGLVAIFYRGIYAGTQEFLFNLGILLTVGLLLKWLCESYLEGSFFHTTLFETPAMQTMPAYLIALTPPKYKREWNRFFENYLSANGGGSQSDLLEMLDAYWAGKAPE